MRYRPRIQADKLSANTPINLAPAVTFAVYVIIAVYVCQVASSRGGAQMVS